MVVSTYKSNSNKFGSCEICGKQTNKLYGIWVEGAEVLVCKNCVRYGESEKVGKNKLSIIPTYHFVERYLEREGNLEDLIDFIKDLGNNKSLYKNRYDGEIVISYSEFFYPMVIKRNENKAIFKTVLNSYDIRYYKHLKRLDDPPFELKVDLNTWKALLEGLIQLGYNKKEDEEKLFNYKLS